MGVRPWFILAAVALARIGFGYQYKTVASLGPDLMRLFQFDYTTLGTLIGAFMMLGAFVAVIVLQNKIIADWFMGQRFMSAISVSVAAYPIGVGLAQLVLPPVALVYGWPRSCRMRSQWQCRWRCSWPPSVLRHTQHQPHTGSCCRADANASCW
jgi:hypothetical protein